jgi:hypothetical protein
VLVFGAWFAAKVLELDQKVLMLEIISPAERPSNEGRFIADWLSDNFTRLHLYAVLHSVCKYSSMRLHCACEVR